MINFNIEIQIIWSFKLIAIILIHCKMYITQLLKIYQKKQKM